MEEKLHKEKEEKEAEKIKSAEKEELNEIKIVQNEQEISVVTEKEMKVEEVSPENPPLYDVNSPRFPSSESKNNIQPSFSTDTHVPYQKSSAEYHKEPERYQQESGTYQHEPEETVSLSYTPGPIRVPTAEVDEENFITVSDLPPIPDTIVEQERLEMIEIKSDGTSGHLSHSLS